MKQILILGLAFLLSACSMQTRDAVKQQAEDVGGTAEILYKEAEKRLQSSEENSDQEELLMNIQIGNRIITANLAETSAAKELAEKLKEGPLTISVTDYGGWEKVGDLPFSLTRDDVQTDAENGDIMLYGRSIVFFYGNNSWAYTRLGRMNGDPQTISGALKQNIDSITISLEE